MLRRSCNLSTTFFTDPAKIETLMNSFITSQFNYYPLVWILHDRGSNSKINRIQERALKQVLILKLVLKDSGTEF